MRPDEIFDSALLADHRYLIYALILCGVLNAF